MIVVDTSATSYIFNRDATALYYLERIRGVPAFISFQTVEERWFGAYYARWGQRRRDELALHLGYYEVVWPDPELADICARLRAERKAAGREIAVADAWIAATALMLDCPLASHDGDFEGIPNLELIRNPSP